MEAYANVLLIAIPGFVLLIIIEWMFSGGRVKLLSAAWTLFRALVQGKPIRSKAFEAQHHHH